MKLIHLPTGQIVTKHSKVKMKSILNSTIYIRAELPEHWRVEGYDKSWEWAQTDVAKHYDVTSDKRLCHASILFEGVEVISRAEFEYHIYNPWKEGQAYAGTFGNEKRTESVHSPYIKTTATNKAECEPTKQPHYNQQPIEVIDMMLSVYGKEAVKNFCLLNSFKYRMRAGHKDDALQDIEKAKWYEAKAKEIDGTPAT